MNKINRLVALIVFFCLFLISACGGGSSTPTLQTPSPEPTIPKPEPTIPKPEPAPPEPTIPLPSAFNLTTLAPSAIKPKTLIFSWEKSTDANNYTLCQFEFDSSKPNNCQILVDNISGQTTDYTFAKVIDPSITDENFFILANNDTGTTSSDEISPTQNDYTKIIGYLKASNISVSDDFGNSVSLSDDGNTLAVGARYEDSSSQTSPNDETDGSSGYNSGAVYVFTRNPDNSWSEPAYLKASNIGSGDYFGYSVSLSGDGNTLAVGANKEDGDARDLGAVYVFTRNPDNSWSQQAYLKTSNIGSYGGDNFGISVSLAKDGNTLAVGAPYEDSSSQTSPNDNTVGNLGYNSGAVYVFTRNLDNIWLQQAYLKASNIGEDDRFGLSVSLSGDGNTLAVGAYWEDGDASNSGAVYVFTRNLNYIWLQQAYLKASNIGESDYFGNPVSLSSDGNTLAVGAIYEDSSSQANPDDNDDTRDSGAVYVFTRNTGNIWSEPAYLKAPNIGAGDYFGTSVSLAKDGNTLAVGARYEASNSQFDQDINDPFPPTHDPNFNSGYGSGAVYVFTRNPDDHSNSWSADPAYLKASNIGPTDQFGYSVSLSSDGNTLAVGAIAEDSGNQNDQTDNASQDSGAVYIF